MRGVRHSAELRGQVLAAILAGATIADTARRYGLSKQTVSRWAAADGTIGTMRAQQDRSPEAMQALLYDYVATIIAAASAQLQAASSVRYVQGQTAGDIAQLLGVERDTIIRLLTGLFPADRPQPDGQQQRPGLDAAGPPEASAE